MQVVKASQGELHHAVLALELAFITMHRLALLTSTLHGRPVTGLSHWPIVTLCCCRGAAQSQHSGAPHASPSPSFVP